MAWFVLVFAIAVALFTEKSLIPLADKYELKLAIRWNYINAVLMAAAPLHAWLKVIHALYILIGAIFAMFLFQRWGKIVTELDQKREIEKQKAREAECILRERVQAERIKQEQAILARKQEYERIMALPMKDFLDEKGCPAGYKCAEMGDDGHGGCKNWESCQKLIRLNVLF